MPYYSYKKIKVFITHLSKGLLKAEK